MRWWVVLVVNGAAAGLAGVALSFGLGVCKGGVAVSAGAAVISNLVGLVQPRVKIGG